MKVTALMERTSDGYYSCFVEQELPGCGLAGYGNTAEEAKSDLMIAYYDMQELFKEEGKEPLPPLEITYKYDFESFFNCFSFLNVTKVAELAGINPSLMRRYTSGVAHAGQKQYDKVKAVIDKISKEMLAASF